MLTQAEIDAMRDVLYMPHSVSIQRETITTDSAGYEVATTSIEATVAGNLFPMSGAGQQVIAGRESLLAPYVLLLPHDADVKPSDKFLIEGETYALMRLMEQAAPLLHKVAHVVIEGDIS